jgi:hypothetical protein
MVAVAVCQPETPRAALAAGTLNEAGTLRVVRAETINARFHGVALAPDAPLRVRVDRRGAVRGVIARRGLRPTRVRRHSLRRPAALRRVAARPSRERVARIR